MKMAEKLFELAQKHWEKPYGLIFSILVAVFLAFKALESLSLQNNRWLLGVGSLIAALCVIGFWLNHKRLPKNRKNKVGIVVCIYCYDEDEKKKLKQDFIDTLKQNLFKSLHGDTFHLIRIPDRFNLHLDNVESATKLMEKTKAHIIIYGRVRKSELNGKEHHFLDLDGVVSHRPIPAKVNKTFSREFRELLPPKISFPTENDLISFEFTSDLIGLVVRYIIGVAAAISYDLDYSERLFRSLKNEIKKIKNANNPIYLRLENRLPLNIVTLYLARIKFSLDQWFKDHNHEHISKITGYLNAISAENLRDDYDVLIIRGIEAFVARKDIPSAKKYFEKCKKLNYNCVWLLNLAFLFAYQGNLRKFVQFYRSCKNADLDPQTVDQIEAFFVWIIEDEPKKIQFHYCLGYFNWHIKGDRERAILDFKEFIDKCPQDQFVKELELAHKWRQQLIASQKKQPRRK